MDNWREAYIEASQEGREVCFLNTLEASIGALQVAWQRLARVVVSDFQKDPRPYLIWLAGLVMILIFVE